MDNIIFEVKILSVKLQLRIPTDDFLLVWRKLFETSNVKKWSRDYTEYVEKYYESKII